MDGSAEKVYLYVYDLTQGMASQLSPMMIGRRIDGIWHSAIVVYGKEYFFGDGICNMAPSTTPFGIPTKKEYLGETEITEDLFLDFLGDIKDRFTPITYNVKSHNCNHFTNECANFLVGSDIPHDILNQAKDLFSTPLGKMIEPMVIQQQDALKQGSNNMFGPSPDSSSGFGAASSSQSTTDAKLIECTGLSHLQDLIEIYPGLIIDVWSPKCGPCIKFKPMYERMSQIYGSDKIKFVTVNAQERPEVAMNLQVTAYPSFYIYKNSQCIDHFKGASRKTLTEKVEALKKELGDPLPGLANNLRNEPVELKVKPDLSFAQFKPYSFEFITFDNSPKLQEIFKEKVIPKVKEIINESYEKEEHKEALAELHAAFESDVKVSELSDVVIKQLLDLISICCEKHIFVIFDYLRVIIKTSNVSKVVCGDGWENFLNALDKLESLSIGDSELTPKEIANAQYTSCAALCNMLKVKGPSKAIIDNEAMANRLLTFAGKMLNSPNKKAISAAASLALNIFIVFDLVEMKPLQEDKKMQIEDKRAQFSERIARLEDGVRSYCESATPVYTTQLDEETLFRLIMSECRLLHCNYKIVEHFASDDDFLKNRMRVTQKFPSGKVNDSVMDLQKIMTSYLNQAN